MIARPSGRAANQPRVVRITKGFTTHAAGSVLVEFGATRVICTASVEGKVPAFYARPGARLDHGRVRHAASRHACAHGP